MVEPRVSIVVLNWNAWETTRHCITSAKNLRYTNFEIILVDNGSTNKAPNPLEGSFPDCQFLQLRENFGYTGGNNAGIRHALSRGADYVLILNNDAVIEDRDMLCKLVSCFLADPKTGIAAPRVREYRPNGVLIGEDYAISRSLRMLSTLVCTRSVKANECLTIQRLEVDSIYLEMMSVMSVSGSVMLISRQIFEVIGFLDERLFMYDDEIDFCLRVIESGYECKYVQNTSVARVTCIPEDMPAYRAYLQGRNRFRLACKRKTSLQFLIFVIAHIASSLGVVAVLLRHKRLKEAASFLKGFWHGVIGRWGMTPSLRRLIVSNYRLETPGESFT